MKWLKIVVVFFVIGLCASCNKMPKNGVDIVKPTILNNIDTTVVEVSKNKSVYFEEVIHVPVIKDTAQFITSLKKAVAIETEPSDLPDKITTYQQVQLYGSTENFVLIEYTFNGTTGAGYPYKYQMLFTAKGKLIKTFGALRYRFVEVFKNKSPFLVVLTVTQHGNGSHAIYKMTNHTLENVCNNYLLPYYLRTYDVDEDYTITKPEELNIVAEDVNNDGCNDLVFTGEILLTSVLENGIWYDSAMGETYTKEHPFKKIPVRFVFLYNKASQHFEMQEDYGAKYSYLKG